MKSTISIGTIITLDGETYKVIKASDSYPVKVTGGSPCKLCDMRHIVHCKCNIPPNCIFKKISIKNGI